MFRIIGIVVVLAVVFFGWDGLSSWYRGESTPASAVNEIRRGVGAAISPGESASASRSSESRPAQANQSAGSAPAPKPSSPGDMASDLIKRAMD